MVLLLLVGSDLDHMTDVRREIFPHLPRIAKYFRQPFKTGGRGAILL
jgi:hypothetical protein